MSKENLLHSTSLLTFDSLSSGEWHCLSDTLPHFTWDSAKSLEEQKNSLPKELFTAIDSTLKKVYSDKQPIITESKWYQSAGKIVEFRLTGWYEAGRAQEPTTKILIQEYTSFSFYKKLVDTTYDWELLVNTDGKVLYCSPACEGITGYSSEEIVQKPLILEQVFNAPSSASPFFESIRQKSRLSLTDFIFKRKDGDLRYIEAAGTPLYDDDGEYVGGRFSIRDITQYRLTEAKMLTELEFLKKAIDYSPAAVLVAEAPDIELIYANPAALAVGYQPKSEHFNAIPKEEYPELWQTLRLDGTACPIEELPLSRAILHGEEVLGEEYILLSANGEQKIITANASPVRHSDGSIAGAVVVFLDITVRRTLELVQLEEYRLFLQGPAAIFRWKIAKEFPVEYVTPNIENILGYTPEDFTQGRVLYHEIVHPDNLQRSLDEIEAAITNKFLSFEQRYRLRHKNGTYRTIADYSTVVYSATGEIIALSGYIIDITGQVENEQRIAQVKWQLQTIVDATDSILIVIAAGSRKTLFLNKAAREFFDGKHSIEEWTEDLLSKHQVSIEAVEGQVLPRVIDEKHDSDTNVWYQRRTIAIEWEEGEAAELIIINNITEQKRAREKERIFVHQMRAIIDNVPSYIFVKDYDGRFLMVNKAVAAVFAEIDPEAVVGKRDEDYGASPEQVEWYIAMDRKVIDSGEPLFIPEEQVQRADGSMGWFQTVKVPFIYPGSPKGAVLGVSVDITERRVMEEHLRHEKERAEAANLAKSEFLANMSHELRTPMNAVLGFTELLLQSQLTDTQRQYMKTVKDSGTMLLTLINDILDFAKIEAEKIVLTCEKTRLIPIAERVVSMFRYSTEAKGIALNLSVADDVPAYIVTDSVRLQQILVNLLGNAVKFTHSGKVSLHIDVIEKQPNSQTAKIRFAVEDTGIGIAPENLQRIFEAFVQADASLTRLYGGTGLGLTISSLLLNMFGSTLEVESTVGIGSTFSFVLDTTYEDSAKVFLREKELDMLRHVLVVAAHKEIFSQAETILLEHGAEVAYANNGIEALQYIENQPQTSLLLIDKDIPFLDGYEITRMVRSQLRRAADDLPIVLLHSAPLSLDDIEHQDQLSINSFCSLPLSLEKIVAAIAHL